jgi:uncharacterized membrane protein (UPF0127 family)
MKSIFFALVLALALPAHGLLPERKLEKKSLEIAGKKVTVEIADDDASRERGLMFRKKLDKNSGMLFVFQDERVRNFWMKNTLIPLSIGYFDSNKTLINVVEMQPEVLGLRELPSYPSEKPAMFALEMEKNWFQKNRIKPGVKFTLSK